MEPFPRHRWLADPIAHFFDVRGMPMYALPVLDEYNLPSCFPRSQSYT
jgi:hypothetical protein